ncbi:two-partner secretion domain-containing protein [Ursidibacter sp. B-7004-1]
MNHIYRIVWNHSTACWQAVSEIGKGKHKVKATKISSTASSSSHLQIFHQIRPLAILVSLVTSSLAVAAPTGGQVTAGQANIQQQGAVTNVHQSSQNAAINWQNFNIKPQETVNFHQPNRDSVTLNRVIGNERSVIEGAINAKGNVFISNPNGVLIGNGSQINVGSLVATTQNISDDDFVKGNYQFDGKGNGRVENLGNIVVPEGGVVALIAPVVKNQGKITASQGLVVLASAEAFRISLPNEHFNYTVKRGTLQGLVDNGGAILAEGGRVVLTAKGISEVKKSVIKHSGVIEANRVTNKGGVVELLGDLDNSELHFSGSIKAEGKGNADGGFVETSAAKVKIDNKARVSTKAKKGKTGKWVIDPKDFTVAKNGGDITGQQVSNNLKSSNVELKSRSGAKEGKGDLVINDEISWDKNTLTLNADNDIHINKTLNGSGTAKLELKFGQGTEDGENTDYIINNNDLVSPHSVRINLPEGKFFILKKGNGGEEVIFDVIHRMPEIRDDGSTMEFGSMNIALGNEIDISYTKNKTDFLGWGDPLGVTIHLHGLGHKLSGLNIHSENEEDGIGLIRSLENSTVRDLSLVDVNIITPNSIGIGGITGYSYSGTFLGNYMSGTIDGRWGIGGVLGESYDGKLIKNGVSLKINGGIECKGYQCLPIHLGGVIGTARNTDIFHNQVLLKVNSNGATIGGLAGYFHSQPGKIEGNHSTVEIISNYMDNGIVAGGLIGQANFIGEFDVKNSYAKVLIKNVLYIGGLIGEGNIYDGAIVNIKNSYIEGEISTLPNRGAYVGGVIGSIASNAKKGKSFLNIDNVYSKANVSGSWRIGGLIGGGYYTYADEHKDPLTINIHNSYAMGKISTISTDDWYKNNEVVGGLIGNLVQSSTVTNSYYNNENKFLNNLGEAISLEDIKDKDIFKDNAWTIDADENGNPIGLPKLRSFLKGDVFIKKNLIKEYDGNAVTLIEDLKALNGWNNINIDGLKEGDTFENSFMGEISIDENNGNWINSVNTGEYSLIVRGLSSDKYRVVYGSGTLKISPKKLYVLMGTKEFDGTNIVNANHITDLNGIIDSDKDKIKVLGSGVLESKNIGFNKLVKHNFYLDDFYSNYILVVDNSLWNITKSSVYNEDLKQIKNVYFMNKNKSDMSVVDYTSDSLSIKENVGVLSDFVNVYNGYIKIEKDKRFYQKTKGVNLLEMQYCLSAKIGKYMNQCNSIFILSSCPNKDFFKNHKKIYCRTYM